MTHPWLEDTLDTYVNGFVADLRPLFRGWFWLAVALVLAIRPGRGRFHLPIRALGISSAAYVLGYLFIVPATNYRYVYWPALACTLGLVLLWPARNDTAAAGPGAERVRVGRERSEAFSTKRLPPASP